MQGDDVTVVMHRCQAVHLLLKMLDAEPRSALADDLGSVHGPSRNVLRQIGDPEGSPAQLLAARIVRYLVG
jgi:hypothetical protein